MFVTTIEFGIPGNVQTASHPCWSTVETHICALDGCDIDGIILQSDSASYMAVSGGMHDEIVVGGYLEGYGSFICASGERDGVVRNVCVNGDFNQYPSKNVINLKQAILAAKAFYENGILTEELIWERQR